VKRQFGTVAVVFGLLLFPTRLPLRMEPPAVVAAVPFPLTVLRGTIAADSSLAETLSEHLSPATIHGLVQAARPTHDLARVNPGRPFGLAFDADGVLAAFTYGIDMLRTLRVVRQHDDWRAEIVTRSPDVGVHVVTGVIRSSLFEAVTGSGEADQLALDLAEIFAWDVDFNTELRRGDTFQVAVERRSLDGRFIGYGSILAAELLRGERRLRAVRFEGTARGGYYAPDGTPLRKAFLRSPLRFTRISSGYSHRRLHPILKRRRPHLGIDYAAPTGTPVHAAADGVVRSAGWQGGFGKAVRLRHANGFETLYGHLSRILVRRGQRVSQGAPIGRVGATGLATGPHLDYRMTRNGRSVNPLRVQLPPAEPIPTEDRLAFDRVRRARLALLSPLSTTEAPAVVRTAGLKEH